MIKMAWLVLGPMLVTLLLVGDGRCSVAPFLVQGTPTFEENELTLWSGSTFPVWIAMDAPPRRYGLPQRTIFLFIEETYFTEANLRTVFRGLAGEQAEPRAVSITAFSDKRMLYRAVQNYKYPLIVDFLPTPEGRKMQEEYYEKHYPLKTGYYRGFYWRSYKGQESSKYSPDPAKDEFIILSLTSR